MTKSKAISMIPARIGSTRLEIKNLPNRHSDSSYFAVDRVEVVVGIASSLTYESAARGNKTAFFLQYLPFQILEVYVMDILKKFLIQDHTGPIYRIQIILKGYRIIYLKSARKNSVESWSLTNFRGNQLMIQVILSSKKFLIRN